MHGRAVPSSVRLRYSKHNCALLVAAATLIACSTISAQQYPAPSPPAATQSSAMQSLDDQQAFDQLVKTKLVAPLQARKIGGAVFVAVRNGKEYYRQAIGYSDVERKIPVDVDKSMFHIASISKTFTATAVAQLKQRGLLDYSDTANSRLKSFQLQQRFQPDINIGNLLTHSTGIPDLFLAAACYDRTSCISLAQFLHERQPAQRAAPGLFTSYSNFSNSVAGQIVADTSGLSFGDYLRTYILRPLHMTATRYDVPGEPGADDRSAFPAADYEINDKTGQLTRAPAYYSMFYPAGQVQTSGADMERYLIAHLQSSPILSDAARLDMQQLHKGPPGLAEGFGWSWTYSNLGGTVVISHGGDLRGVVSDLRLVPSRGFGYFVAVTGDAGQVLDDFAAAFAAHYIALPEKRPSPPPPTGEVPPDLPGVYQDFRFSNRDPLQMLSFLNEARVDRISRGMVRVRLPALLRGGEYTFGVNDNDRNELYVLSGPQERPYSPNTKLRFIRERGAIRFIAINDNEYQLVAERLPLVQQSRFKYPILLGLLAVLLISFVGATVGLARQARRRSSGDYSRLALMGILVGAVSALAFPIIVGARLAGGSVWDMLYGIRWMGLRWAFLLPWISSAGFITVLVCVGTALRRRSWTRTTFSFCAVAVVAGVFYLIMLALNAQFQVKVY